jgi:hypothetical protein
MNLKHIATAAVTGCCLRAPALAGLYDAYEPDRDGGGTLAYELGRMVILISIVAVGFWEASKVPEGRPRRLVPVVMVSVWVGLIWLATICHLF